MLIHKRHLAESVHQWSIVVTFEDRHYGGYLCVLMIVGVGCESLSQEPSEMVRTNSGRERELAVLLSTMGSFLLESCHYPMQGVPSKRRVSVGIEHAYLHFQPRIH